jgi:trigger factor
MEDNMGKCKATVTSPLNTERHLDIEIPRERFTGIFREKVKKYSKELTMPGYRKGAIPKRLVEERFKEPITTESLEKLVEEVIQEVCLEHNIKPVAPGKVDDLKNEDGQPIHVKAVIEVDQEIEFNNYTNLGIKIDKSEPVTVDFIESQVGYYCKKVAKEEKKEGSGEVGDIATGEYLEISIDNEIQNLEDQKDFRIEIGADNIQQFNDAFIGCKAGEEKEITLTYPQDYSQPALAGKTGYYKVRILEILKREIPEPDDQLARQLGSKDLADFKDAIRRNEEEFRLKRARDRAEEQALRKIMETHPFEIPKARIKQYIEYQQTQMGAKSGKLSKEEDSALESEALFYLKRFRIISQISRKEKIKATQEEVDAKITELAGQYNMDFDTLKASLRKSGRINDIREELKARKTMDFILGSN